MTRARVGHALGLLAVVLGVVLAHGLPAQLPAVRTRAIPTPASVLGFEPGVDRKLPEWRQVVAYFTALGRASPRIAVRTLGETTLRRPFIAAFIGDSATIANLPRYQALQRRLADPRLLAAGELPGVLANGKVVVLVTSSIHSTEVGGILTPLVLAERLVGGEDAAATAIRRNALVILVPSLNPDGVDIVGDWYRSSLGTPVGGDESTGALSPLHGARQQPRLVRVHAGRDADGDRLAL